MFAPAAVEGRDWGGERQLRIAFANADARGIEYDAEGSGLAQVVNTGWIQATVRAIATSAWDAAAASAGVIGFE